MGTWDELNTTIRVVNEISDLEDLIDKYGGEDIFSPIVEHAEKVKKAIEEGSKRGAKELAVKDRTYQQELLDDKGKHPNAQGVLSTSIKEEEEGDAEWLIGTTIAHFYPLCVEYGRGEVHPIPPNTRLKFYGKEGYLIYPKMSASAPARPFVEPAFEKTVELEEKQQMILREINHAIDG